MRVLLAQWWCGVGSARRGRPPLWIQAATRARHKADAACARCVSGACARRLYALCLCQSLCTSETGNDVVHYLDQPPVAPSFARLLKQHRLASGLTQEGLAERAVMRLAHPPELRAAVVAAVRAGVSITQVARH